jgi:DNA-binding CsgD family transcriptional regulator
MIVLAAHRRPASPAVEPQSRDLVTSLAAHLASLALDYIETAVFVLDADLRMYFASAAAKRLLDRGRLCVRNGLLVSPNGSEAATLRRAVRQCAEAVTSGPVRMTFQRLGDVEDVLCLGLVVAARDPRSSTSEKPFLLVFATEPCEASLPDTRQLRSHFGLTDAQARLAIEIAKGEGLKVCTRRLGIAMSTGRSHLKQIFEKTETKRQAELVRLISACRFNVPEG